MNQIQQTSDEQMMELALEQARLAGAHGEIPIGAVVCRGGRAIAKGHNLTRRLQDATLHAEIVAMRGAASRLGHWYMQDCTLYVTIEPCTQCAGSLLLARMGRLVFGAAEPKFGACGSVFNLLANPRLNHRVELTAGVMAEQCSAVMKQFFRELRDC